LTRFADIYNPAIDIKANGSDGPVFVSTIESVNVSLSIEPSGYGGDTVDWWGLMTTSHNPYWSLFFHSQFAFVELPTASLFDIPLPPGWYVFLFNVDDTPDGAFQSCWYDYVVVVCQWD
jgi:hypothetical protein